MSVIRVKKECTLILTGEEATLIAKALHSYAEHKIKLGRKMKNGPFKVDQDAGESHLKEAQESTVLLNEITEAL